MVVRVEGPAVFFGCVDTASKQQVPRLQRSFASRTIFFARDDRSCWLFFRFELMSEIPFRRQVFPRRIPLSDQPFFLGSVPPLQLLLSVNRLIHIVERFVVNQPMTFVLPGKAFNQIVLVLKNSPVKVVGHPDVQNARLARDHVRAVVVLFHTSHTLSSRPRTTVSEAGRSPRGGTCCASAAPMLEANSRSLDYEDCPLLRTISFARDDRATFIFTLLRT